MFLFEFISCLILSFHVLYKEINACLEVVWCEEEGVPVLGSRPGMLVEVVRKGMMEINFMVYFVLDDNNGRYRINVSG